MPADKVSKTSNRFTPYDLGRRPLHEPFGNHQGKTVRSAGAVDLSQYYLCTGFPVAPASVTSLAGRCLANEAQQGDINPQKGFLLSASPLAQERHCNTNGTVTLRDIPVDHGGYGYLCNQNLDPYQLNGTGNIGITEANFQDVCIASANNCVVEPSATFLPNTSPAVGTDLVTTDNVEPSMSPTAIAGMSVAFPVALAVGITVVVVAAGITTTIIIYKRIRDRIMGSADVTNDVVQWSTTGGTHIVDNRIAEEADKLANALKNSGSSASSEPNNDLDAPQYAIIDGQHITFKNLDSKEETV